MIGSSEIIRENALEHKKKKPVLSINQASNNWALGVMCKVSNRKTLSGETFCLIEKHLLSVFKFCASSKLFSYELLIGRQPSFLGTYSYFPVI